MKHKYNCKTLQKINKWTAEQMEQGKMTRPPSGKCTGCGVRFTRDYGCYGTCPQCGYEACESCICHDRRGTCHCSISNFGNLYCLMSPKWYHANGITWQRYFGDRHPPLDDFEHEPSQFEIEPRKCRNCGKTTRMLKREFCT